MADAGATAKEVAAVLGHTGLDQVETYTRDADQRRLADAAMQKLIGVDRQPLLDTRNAVTLTLVTASACCGAIP